MLALRRVRVRMMKCGARVSLTILCYGLECVVRPTWWEELRKVLRVRQKPVSQMVAWNGLFNIRLALLVACGCCGMFQI